MGPTDRHVKEVKLFNIIVRLVDTGLELEADPRHAELVIRELELENAKPSRVPGSNIVRSKTVDAIEEPEEFED